MDRLGRVQEGGGGPQAGERRGGLPPDQPGLAHSGDDHAAGLRFDQVGGVEQPGRGAFGEGEEGVGLGAEDVGGPPGGGEPVEGNELSGRDSHERRVRAGRGTGV